MTKQYPEDTPVLQCILSSAYIPCMIASQVKCITVVASTSLCNMPMLLGIAVCVVSQLRSIVNICYVGSSYIIQLVTRTLTNIADYGMTTDINKLLVDGIKCFHLFYLQTNGSVMQKLTNQFKGTQLSKPMEVSIYKHLIYQLGLVN